MQKLVRDKHNYITEACRWSSFFAHTVNEVFPALKSLFSEHIPENFVPENFPVVGWLQDWQISVDHKNKTWHRDLSGEKKSTNMDTFVRDKSIFRVPPQVLREGKLSVSANTFICFKSTRHVKGLVGFSVLFISQLFHDGHGWNHVETLNSTWHEIWWLRASREQWRTK